MQYTCILSPQGVFNNKQYVPVNPHYQTLKKLKLETAHETVNKNQTMALNFQISIIHCLSAHRRTQIRLDDTYLTLAAVKTFED